MRRITNCPYCGKLHSIEIGSKLDNVYILPGTQQQSKSLWSLFRRDNGEILVSEVTCPYCGRVSTVVSIRGEVVKACVIKRPPIMRLLFAEISFSFQGREFRVFPLYWILFSVMIMGYSQERLMLSLLSAVLLIAFTGLLRGINDFQTFDFLGNFL